MSLAYSMPLAPTTLKNYTAALSRLEKAGQLNYDGPNNTILLHSTLIEYLTKRVVNPGSRKVYIYAILNEIKDWSEEAKAPYVKIGKELSDTCAKLAVSQTLKESRAVNMLDWYNVTILYTKAKRILSPEDFLIYCLYTLNPPVRADYVNMPVIYHYGTTPRTDVTKNYCVVHNEEAYFVFNVYKTAKAYGQTIVSLDPILFEMVKDIPNHTMLLPAITTENMLSKRVMSIFNTLANKKMGIGLLRHSFITTYLKTIRRIIDKEAIANKMMHSWIQQEAYHIITDDDEPFT